MDWFCLRLYQAKYERQDGQVKEYILKPLWLVFSEYYFYLVGEIVGKSGSYLIVFRVDRFQRYDITEEKFSMPHKDRFEEEVKRWLISQKEFLEVIRPEEYREEIKETIEKMLSNYQ